MGFCFCGGESAVKDNFKHEHKTNGHSSNTAHLRSSSEGLNGGQRADAKSQANHKEFRRVEEQTSRQETWATPPRDKGANSRAEQVATPPEVERDSAASLESPPSFKGFLSASDQSISDQRSLAQDRKSRTPSEALKPQTTAQAVYEPEVSRERKQSAAWAEALPSPRPVASPLHSRESERVVLENEKAEIAQIKDRKKARDNRHTARTDSDASTNSAGLWQAEAQRHRNPSISSNGSAAYKSHSLGLEAQNVRPGYHSRAQSDSLSQNLLPSRNSSLASKSGWNSVRDSDSGARPATLHSTRSGSLSGAPGETGQNGADLYEIIGPLGGASSSGLVRIMRDRRTKDLVAARWVQHTHGEALSIHLEREIVNHRRLLHPNIIRFREVFATDEYLVIVMDYASIGPLSERIESGGPLTEDVAKLLFRQLVDGMVYCHRQGVVHRNLVLGNLLLDGHAAKPVLKISGFAYSKAPDLDSAPKSAVTAPMFLSPEVLLGTQRGQVYDGRASDVWACGIILFNIVTGKLPFQDEGEVGMQGAFKSTQRILNCQYEFPTTARLSAEVKDLVAKIFVQDPKQRIDSYDLTRHPWLTGAALPVAKPEMVVISEQSESDISDIMARARKRREARLAAQKAKLKTPEHFNEDLLIE